MATVDVAGKRRPGIFEQIQLPDGKSVATPVSGRGDRTRLRVSGPAATATPEFDFGRAHGPLPTAVGYAARESGAAEAPELIGYPVLFRSARGRKA